jgi:hypothetical protein
MKYLAIAASWQGINSRNNRKLKDTAQLLNTKRPANKCSGVCFTIRNPNSHKRIYTSVKKIKMEDDVALSGFAASLCLVSGTIAVSKCHPVGNNQAKRLTTPPNLAAAPQITNCRLEKR